MNVRRWFLWIFFTWHAVVGIWPWADPEHDMVSLLSRLDVGVHLASTVALGILLFSYVYHKPPRTEARWLMVSKDGKVTETDSNGVRTEYQSSAVTFTIGRRTFTTTTWKKDKS